MNDLNKLILETYQGIKYPEPKDFDVADAVRSSMEAHGHPHEHLEIEDGGPGHPHISLGTPKTVHITHDYGKHGTEPIPLHAEPFKQALGKQGYRITRGNYSGDGAAKTQKWSFDVFAPKT